MENISLSVIAVTLWETFGWLSVIGAAIGLLALIVLWRALRRASRRNLGAMRLLGRGLLVALLVAAILTPFVPIWTMSHFADLYSVVDVLSAYAMALAPSAVVGVIWIYFGSHRTAHRVAVA